MDNGRTGSVAASGTIQAPFTNIYIKNFGPDVTDSDLHNVFSKFGPIISHVILKENGVSKGCGFVNFQKPESAKLAVAKVNGVFINGKQWHVSAARPRESEAIKYTNIFIKNFGTALDDAKLLRIVGPFGPVTSCKVNKDDNGVSKGFGFVIFVNQDDAKKAVEALNGKVIEGKKWYVDRAKSRQEREIETTLRKPTACTPQESVTALASMSLGERLQAA